MDRDPTNWEGTRDPIFLFQVGTRQWTEIPEGCVLEDGLLCISESSEMPDWIVPYFDGYGGCTETDEFWRQAEARENSCNGWPLVYTEWRTESVFLTRKEAEDYGNAHHYCWEKWKVHCIPCDGELAKLLNSHVPGEAERLRETLRAVVDGNWCITEVQEALGDV